MNSFYRIVRDGGQAGWNDTGYGPYSSLAVARNVASQQFGGYWRGVNSVTKAEKIYNHVTNERGIVQVTYKIQKLTAVLKPFKEGFPALLLGLDWVDVDAG